MTGLALSGGAAFGAYQAGAWLELASRGYRPDVVSGVSIGGVNGFLIAHGAESREILQVWREWPAELLPSRERGFILPWMAQTPMFRAWLERIGAEFGGRPLQCRLRLVALELPSFRTVVREDEAADARALLAACALPGVLAPLRINGRWCADSGLLRHMPLRECLDAGVDQLIAVDLLKKHPFMAARWARVAALRTLDRVRGERSEPSPEELAGVDYLEICHPKLLGSATDCFRWNRDFVDRLIALGRQDACSRLDRHANAAAARHSSQPVPVKTAPT